jgi:hypothetical protein
MRVADNMSLKDKIESLREELDRYAEAGNLNSEEILEISVKMDRLITEYSLK